MIKNSSLLAGFRYYKHEIRFGGILFRVRPHPDAAAPDSVGSFNTGLPLRSATLTTRPSGKAPRPASLRFPRLPISALDRSIFASFIVHYAFSLSIL